MFETFVDTDKVRKLKINFEPNDSLNLFSYFPITLALWRGGYKVLYAGHNPGMRKKISTIDDHCMTDSYIVTENQDYEKECWLLPPTCEKWLKSFLTKKEYKVAAVGGVHLWQVPCDPNDITTVRVGYTGETATGTEFAQYQKLRTSEMPTLLFGRSCGDPAPRPAVGYQVREDSLEKDIYDFRCRTAEDKLVIKSQQDRIEKLNENLDLAEVMSCDNFDLLQKERRKARDRANVIIDMTKAAENNRLSIKAMDATNAWQAGRIASLMNSLNVKQQSNIILHEVNNRFMEERDEARKGARPLYEVEANRDVSLSSFKMSTIATAVRWVCAASMSGTLAYMLV